jgi:hypothetical protein
MAFSANTMYRAAFKILFGKSHTSGAKDLVNEAKSAFVQLGANQIFGQTIDPIPANAVAAGVAEYVICTLVLDATSAGLSYQATYPIGHPLVGQNVTNIIPQSYGDPYRAILKNNGTEVPPLDASNWFLTGSSGVVTSETALSLVTGTLEVYRYKGQMVLDRLNTATVAANIEVITLSSTNIANGYVDLANVAALDTVTLNIQATTQIYGVDYTVNLTGGVGGKTRVYFTGDLANPLTAQVAENDVIEFNYIIAN